MMSVTKQLAKYMSTNSHRIHVGSSSPIENHTPGRAHVEFNKLKISEPRAFNRNWDVKELKKFIFDVEQYFKAIGTCSKKLKNPWPLSISEMMWWCLKVNDIHNGLCTINSRDDLKE